MAHFTISDHKAAMSLLFQPKVGSVLMCSFDGFVEPEMIKQRPVVVIARNRGNNQLVTIVPLSTTPPDEMQPHHYKLPFNPVPASKGVNCWAKCDLVATLSIARMDRLKDRHVRVIPHIAQADLDAIRLGVVNAMQLQNVILAGQAKVAFAAVAAAAAVANAAIEVVSPAKAE